MCIFFFFDIVLFILALNYNERNKRLFYWISALILLFLLGMHNGTGDPHGYGYDYPHYLNFFRGKNDMYGSVDSPSTYELEWPYFYFCKFLRLIGNYDFIYIIGLCLIVNVPFLLYVKKYSNNASLSILWLFLIQNTQTHLFINTAHRQMVAHAFFMMGIFAIMSFYEKNEKWFLDIKKDILIAFCLIIAVLGHSSSYFVIVALLVCYFLPQISKKKQIFVVFASMIVGVFMYKVFLSYFTNLMFLLRDVEEISRSTHYLVDDVYGTANSSINALLPQTLMTIGVIYSCTEIELKSIFVKCLFLATISVNIFYSVPLISRSFTTLWILAITGCIPIAFRNTTKGKVILSIIVLAQLYTAYKAYASPSFRLLPFKFIWE